MDICGLAITALANMACIARSAHSSKSPRVKQHALGHIAAKAQGYADAGKAHRRSLRAGKFFKAKGAKKAMKATKAMKAMKAKKAK